MVLLHRVVHYNTAVLPKHSNITLTTHHTIYKTLQGENLSELHPVVNFPSYKQKYSAYSQLVK